MAAPDDPVLMQDCRLSVAGRGRKRIKPNNPNSTLLRAMQRMVARGHLAVRVVDVVEQMAIDTSGHGTPDQERMWEVTLGVTVQHAALRDDADDAATLVSTDGDFRIVMYGILGDIGWSGGASGGDAAESGGDEDDRDEGGDAAMDLPTHDATMHPTLNTTTALLAADEMRGLLFSMMLPPVDAPMAEEPSGLLCTLFDYQRQALHWMLCCEGEQHRDVSGGAEGMLVEEVDDGVKGDQIRELHRPFGHHVNATATRLPKSDAPHCLFEHLTLPSGERVWWNKYNGMCLGDVWT